MKAARNKFPTFVNVFGCWQLWQFCLVIQCWLTTTTNCSCKTSHVELGPSPAHACGSRTTRRSQCSRRCLLLEKKVCRLDQGRSAWMMQKAESGRRVIIWELWKLKPCDAARRHANTCAPAGFVWSRSENRVGASAAAVADAVRRPSFLATSQSSKSTAIFLSC